MKCNKCGSEKSEIVDFTISTGQGMIDGEGCLNCLGKFLIKVEGNKNE